MDQLSVKIVEAFKSGNNSDALRPLYEQALPKIFQYVRKNGGDFEDAKDLLQETILILHQQILKGKFDQRYEVLGFMYSVARNQWINKAKREKIYHKDPEFDYDYHHNIDATQLGDMITEERKTAVDQLMEKIGEPCKSLLKYIVVEGLKLEEVRKKMNFTSTNTVKTYNYRCKKKLMDMIKSDSYYSTVLTK